MAIPPLRLKSLVPTQEELDAAKRLIEEAKDPSKKLANAMQSLKHWVQTTGAAENPEALESKLEERKAYMYQFLVHVARHKKAKLNQIVAKTHTAHKKTVGTEGVGGVACSRLQNRGEAAGALDRERSTPHQEPPLPALWR